MKYILGVFGVIVLLLVIVILIVRSGPSEPVSTVKTGKPQLNLAEYEAKPAIASFTARGQITADETRRAIRITVSQQERAVEILDGYDESILSRQTFPNNSDAYKIFLSALSSAGFTLEKETLIEDERGVCPFGKRYVYKLQEGSTQAFRAWSTTCRRDQGNFGGNTGTVRRLFEQQIPDYRTAVRGIRL